MKKCDKHPNKSRYNTQKDAEIRLSEWQYALLRPTRMKCYHCDSCDGWHLSSKKTNPF